MIFNALASRPRLRRFATFFSPKGANSHIFDVELIEESGVFRASHSFRHELAGWHQLGLIVEHRIENPIQQPILLDVSCDLHLPEKSVALLHGKAPLTTPWWSGSESNGFRLKMYAVPDDAPRGVDVTLKFAAEGLKLREKYGRIKVFIAPMNVW
jgi:hypothetical protein